MSNLNNLICTEVNTFDIMCKPMWIVTLSDGVVVYQNDDNPSFAYKNSWLGLKKYVEKNNLFIRDMSLRFRDHTEFIGSGEAGYYFIHMILGSFIGYTQFFYNVGILKDGLIKGNQWIIPELIILESFERRLEDEYVMDSFIRGK